MGIKQHISRTWQMIEQQVNDVPFRPDYEAYRQIIYICELRIAKALLKRRAFVRMRFVLPQKRKSSLDGRREYGYNELSNIENRGDLLRVVQVAFFCRRRYSDERNYQSYGGTPQHKEV